jgi:hypothetical protein
LRLSELAHVSDNMMQLLHTFTRLQELLHAHIPDVELTICMVSGDALANHQRQWCMRVKPTVTLRESPDGVLLHFPARPNDRFGSPQLRLRWCKTWEDAAGINDKMPVLAVFITNLQWFFKTATHAEREECWKQAAADLKAPLLPPLSWFNLLERKEAVYEDFKKFMLPARWVHMGESESIQDFVPRLLENLKDGDYFVKGNSVCGSATGEQVTVSGGMCKELESIVRRYVQVYKQRCIGMVEFAPGLREKELRTWLVASEGKDTHLFVPSITLNTSQVMRRHHGETSAILEQPVDDVGIAVAKLIQQMLQQRADFFQQLHAMGARAVRVDCGYHKGRAFFCEFSPAGDSYVWTGVHELALSAKIGRDLVRSEQKKGENYVDV